MAMSCSKSNLSNQTKTFCDSIWTMCLEDDYDIDASTLADTTTDGYSHLVDTSAQRRTQNRTQSKKAAKKSQQQTTAAEGDKVMTYFLGKGDDAKAEGERAKQTFRRRKKKRKQAQNSQPGEAVGAGKPVKSEEKPKTATKYGTSAPYGGAEDKGPSRLSQNQDVTLPLPIEVEGNVPTKVISVVPKSKRPDKYSPMEDGEDADVQSFDTKSTLTTPTVLLLAARDQPTRVGEYPPDFKDDAQVFESREPETSKQDGISKSTAYKKGSRSRDLIPPRQKDLLSRKDTKRESKHRNNKDPNYAMDHREVNRRRHTRQEELRHSTNHHMGERDMRAVTNRFASDKYMPSATPRKRQTDLLSNYAKSWNDFSPSGYQGEVPQVSRAITPPPPATTATRKHVAEVPASDFHRTPHVISDISRRELELRSIGVYGQNDQTKIVSPPRLGGGENGYRYSEPIQADFEYDHGRYPSRGRDSSRGRDASRGREALRTRDSSRGRDSPRGRTSSRGRDSPRGRDSSRGRDLYRDLYSARSMPQRGDEQEYVSQYDDYRGIPASVKLEIGARVARRQSEKSLASHLEPSKLLSRRSPSVPEQRLGHDSDEIVPELLTAGSLKL